MSRCIPRTLTTSLWFQYKDLGFWIRSSPNSADSTYKLNALECADTTPIPTNGHQPGQPLESVPMAAGPLKSSHCTRRYFASSLSAPATNLLYAAVSDGEQ